MYVYIAVSNVGYIHIAGFEAIWTCLGYEAEAKQKAKEKRNQMYLGQALSWKKGGESIIQVHCTMIDNT